MVYLAHDALYENPAMSMAAAGSRLRAPLETYPLETAFGSQRRWPLIRIDIHDLVQYRERIRLLTLE